MESQRCQALDHSSASTFASSLGSLTPLHSPPPRATCTPSGPQHRAPHSKHCSCQVTLRRSGFRFCCKLCTSKKKILNMFFCKFVPHVKKHAGERREVNCKGTFISHKEHPSRWSASVSPGGLPSQESTHVSNAQLLHGGTPAATLCHGPSDGGNRLRYHPTATHGQGSSFSQWLPPCTHFKLSVQYIET